MDFLKINGLSARQTFKSFDIKDTRIFRSTENLVNISNEEPWIVYCAKNFKKDALDMNDYEILESKFSKKLQSYAVSFSKLKGLPFSVPSLLVQVSQKGKVVYNSVFLSVSNDSDMETLSPILLVSKSSKKTAIPLIHSVLQKVIGCQLRPVLPSESQQYWILGICLHETLRRDRASSDMRIRCKVRLIHTEPLIELNLLNDSLVEIWSSIPDSSKNSLDLDTVETLLSEIFEHFYETYGINLSTAPIISLSLKDICVSFGEQMTLSIKKPEIAFSLLSYVETECSAS